MKRIIIVFLALFLVVPLFSQEGETNDEGFQPGYIGIVEAGSSIAWRDDVIYQLRAGLHIINAYQFNPHLTLGIGAGAYRAYIFDDQFRSITNGLYIPVFGDIRINFMKAKANPYISLGLGYSFLPLYSTEEAYPNPGLYLNATVGINKKFSEKFAMHVGLGFSLHGIEYNSSGIVDNGPHQMPGVSLNLGFSI